MNQYQTKSAQNPVKLATDWAKAHKVPFSPLRRLSAGLICDIQAKVGAAFNGTRFGQYYTRVDITGADQPVFAHIGGEWIKV